MEKKMCYGTAKMFRIAGLMLAAGIVVCLAGCMTKTPIQNRASFPPDGSKYVILGRVSVQIDMERKGGGYLSLVEEAQRLYPNADDVVNVVVDGKGKHNKPPRYLIMSGIAIDYLEVKMPEPTPPAMEESADK